MPVALAAVGIAAAVAGSAISTISAIRSSQVSADQAEAEATYRELEAKNAENASALEAANIRAAAAYSEQQARRRLQYVLSTNRAIGASSGVDISSGSPMMAEIENVKQAELEALNIRRGGEVLATTREYEGMLQAQERRFFASNQRYQAKLFREQIPWIIAAGIINPMGGGANAAYNMGAFRSTESSSQSVIRAWAAQPSSNAAYGSGAYGYMY